MEYVCCICGGWFEGWGNNPWPVVDDADAICCDKCNAELVVPFRIKQVLENGHGTEQHK
jgi:hypothetical protein